MHHPAALAFVADRTGSTRKRSRSATRPTTFFVVQPESEPPDISHHHPVREIAGQIVPHRPKDLFTRQRVGQCRRLIHAFAHPAQDVRSRHHPDHMILGVDGLKFCQQYGVHLAI